MMKILALLLLGLSMPADARTPRPQTDTQDFAVEKCTSTTISITSHTAVDVINSSVYLSSATFLEVYNVDSTSFTNCGFESNVSTINSSYLYGREIPKSGGLGLTINLDKFHETGYHCKTQSVTSATRATITKCR